MLHNTKLHVLSSHTVLHVSTIRTTVSNMNRLDFTMEPKAFSVRYEQNNLYMKCRLILLFKGLCEGSCFWLPASHWAGPGSFLRTDNKRFVVNDMAMRQVSPQFFVVPPSALYSYFISVFLLSQKYADEARKPSSKAMFFRISWSTANKNVFLDSGETFWPWGVWYFPISGLTLGRKNIGHLWKWYALQGLLFVRGSVNNCSKVKLHTTLTNSTKIVLIARTLKTQITSTKCTLNWTTLVTGHNYLLA